MTLSIRNPRAERLARQLAGIDGGTLTAAVVTALEEAVRNRIKRETASETAARVLAELGLKRPADRTPLPDSVYHDLDEDLTGRYDE